MDLFEAAKRISRMRRDKLMDVTPWHNEDIALASRVIGERLDAVRVRVRPRMVRAFQEELVAQGLLKGPVPERELFPLALEPSNAHP